MKASAFSYARATCVGNALELLAAHGDGAKVLSGGQSLMPAINLRLLSPQLLVDIGDLAELRGIELNGGMLRIARTPEGWDARFICLVGFYPCVGVRDEALAAKLERAFDDPQWWAVQSLHVGTPPERGACWIAGDGWWLSKHALRKAA